MGNGHGRKSWDENAIKNIVVAKRENVQRIDSETNQVAEFKSILEIRIYNTTN